MIKVMIDSSVEEKGEIDLAIKGDLSDIAFELSMICSSVIGAVEEDSDVELGNELRKGLAKYLISSIIEGDPLKDVKSQAVAIDGRAYEFLKQYKKMRDDGCFD